MAYKDKEKDQAYMREWREKNREHLREYARKNHADNAEKRNARSRELYKARALTQDKAAVAEKKTITKARKPKYPSWNTKKSEGMGSAK